MNQLAVQSGGEMIYPDQINQLQNLIAQNTSSKPVMHEITKTQSIINLRWVFFIILGLLSLEWVIRKYNGVI